LELKCIRMRLADELHPDPLGSYSAPPGILAGVKGRGREREKTQEREVKGERDKKGRDNGGEEYGMGRGWKGKQRSRGEYKRGNCLH